MLVDAGLALQQLLVQQEEDDGRARLRVHGHAEVVRVAGRDAHVAWEKQTNGGDTYWSDQKGNRKEMSLGEQNGRVRQ